MFMCLSMIIFFKNQRIIKSNYWHGNKKIYTMFITSYTTEVIEHLSKEKDSLILKNGCFFQHTLSSYFCFSRGFGLRTTF